MKSSKIERRFKIAYNPGVGGAIRPEAEVKAHVRDYLADMDDVEDEEIEVIVSRNIPADNRFWVFNVALLEDLA